MHVYTPTHTHSPKRAVTRVATAIKPQPGLYCLFFFHFHFLTVTRGSAGISMPREHPTPPPPSHLNMDKAFGRWWHQSHTHEEKSWMKETWPPTGVWWKPISRKRSSDSWTRPKLLIFFPFFFLIVEIHKYGGTGGNKRQAGMHTHTHTHLSGKDDHVSVLHHGNRLSSNDEEGMRQKKGGEQGALLRRWNKQRG